jgi:hypothetical protein
VRSLLIAAMLAAPASVSAAEYVAPDYANDASWLCRPGRADACAVDLGTTSVAADGKTLLVTARAPARDPAFDCFYVYPTVSTDRTGNSDMVADPAETNVARVQFAAFRNVCRPFAPLYRQVTLKALRDFMTGQATDADRMMAYRDVVAAWESYLARDNHGRGVILIGHSQGSGVIKALLANTIEGKPAAKQLIAAYVPGHNVLVPVGKDVGGDLKSTPLCRSDSQTGCVMAWVSFRDGATPPANSRFGRTDASGMSVACTNPAALSGGRGTAHPLLPSGPAIVDNTTQPRPWARDAKVTTPFVALPGLLSAECKSVDGANVLAIATNADPADPRIDDIGGDVVVGGQVFADWGLHLIDVNVVQGDMLVLAEKQGKAWLAKQGPAANAP